MCSAQHVIAGISRIGRQSLLQKICPRTTFATVGLFLQQSPKDLDDCAHRCPFLLHNAGQTAFQAFIGRSRMQPVMPRALKIGRQLMLQYLMHRCQRLHMPVGFGSRLPRFLLPVVVVLNTYVLPVFVIGQALV